MAGNSSESEIKISGICKSSGITITPEELDGWLDTLQENLDPELRTEPNETMAGSFHDVVDSGSNDGNLV